mgnify:CR=1 FL=1
MGISSIRAWQLVNYFKSHGSTYRQKFWRRERPDIETFAQMYYEEATAEGVRPEVAFAQAMKETGWLQYGGDMQITQYNFAGIGRREEAYREIPIRMSELGSGHRSSI